MFSFFNTVLPFQIFHSLKEKELYQGIVWGLPHSLPPPSQSTHNQEAMSKPKISSSRGYPKPGMEKKGEAGHAPLPLAKEIKENVREF